MLHTSRTSLEIRITHHRPFRARASTNLSNRISPHHISRRIPRIILQPVQIRLAINRRRHNLVTLRAIIHLNTHTLELHSPLPHLDLLHPRILSLQATKATKASTKASRRVSTRDSTRSRPPTTHHRQLRLPLAPSMGKIKARHLTTPLPRVRNHLTPTHVVLMITSILVIASEALWHRAASKRNSLNMATPFVASLPDKSTNIRTN